DQSQAVANVDGTASPSAHADGKAAGADTAAPADKAATADGKSVGPAGDTKVGSKVDTGGMPDGHGSTSAPEAPAPVRRFNFGWVLAIAGIVIFGFVMFKGHRAAKNSAAAD